MLPNFSKLRLGGSARAKAARTPVPVEGMVPPGALQGPFVPKGEQIVAEYDAQRVNLLKQITEWAEVSEKKSAEFQKKKDAWAETLKKEAKKIKEKERMGVPGAEGEKTKLVQQGQAWVKAATAERKAQMKAEQEYAETLIAAFEAALNDSEPDIYAKTAEWARTTVAMAHKWYAEHPDDDETVDFITTDSLAEGYEQSDAWDQTFWVATSVNVRIPYNSYADLAPEPKWADSHEVFPAPDGWKTPGPQSLIQVTPSGRPQGVNFIHKGVLLTMFAKQRQEHPDGYVLEEDGEEVRVKYPEAYKGPGYGGHYDFLIPRPNATNRFERIEMRSILNAFLEECNGVSMTFNIAGEDTVVKLYNKIVDDDPKQDKVEVSSNGVEDRRQLNPFPTPWRYGKGVSRLHYVDTPYVVMDPAPPSRRLPASILGEIHRWESDAEEEEEDEDEEDEDEEEEEGVEMYIPERSPRPRTRPARMEDYEVDEDSSSEEEEEDVEMENANPQGGEAFAIADANELLRISQELLATPGNLTLKAQLRMVGARMIGRISSDVRFPGRAEYNGSLEDLDVSKETYLKALGNLWNGLWRFSFELQTADVLRLFNASVDKQESNQFDILQIVATNVPRLELLIEDPVIEAGAAARSLLTWVNDSATATAGAPATDLEDLAKAVREFKSTGLGTHYAAVANVMRRIAFFAGKSYPYLRYVTQDDLLAYLLISLFEAIGALSQSNELDLGVYEVNFLNTMTDLPLPLQAGFMANLREKKDEIVAALRRFTPRNQGEQLKVDEVIRRLEAPPPPAPLSQQRQASTPAVRGAEALREISNNSPSDESSDEEDATRAAPVRPRPADEETPNPRGRRRQRFSARYGASTSRRVV